MPNPLPARPVPAALPRQLALSTDEPLLDAERLDAYRVALDFQQLVGELLPRRGQSSLRDQLERASASTVLNLAEGAGRSAPRDKAHFYAVSRGSAMECAAVLDVLTVRGFASPLACRRGRALLVRVVQMTTKLNRPDARLRRAHPRVEGRRDDNRSRRSHGYGHCGAHSIRRSRPRCGYNRHAVCAALRL